MNQEDRCQVGSVSGALHISIYGTGPGVGGWRTEKPADTLLWLPPVKWTVGPGEKEETVFGAARLHFLPQWASAAPEGHADGFTCHLLFSATCFKFIIVASQLPQRQLGGLFKAKWYLRAVRRRTHTHRHTHIHSVYFCHKAASESNHGDQNTAVSSGKQQVMTLMKCWTVSVKKKKLRATFDRSLLATVS